MTSYAKVIADSVSPDGVRVTTMEVRFHRFVLAEFNTHRVFSRNSASSRAIPIERTLARATASPVSYPCEQPGMSGGAELRDNDLLDAIDLLMRIREFTTKEITLYLEAHPDKSTRLHKSILNRPAEWFQWHTVIVTSTEWQNFFHQRLAPNAQPEIRQAAELMYAALNDSTPSKLDWGEWHAPYASLAELDSVEEFLKVSTARCARVSYLNHDGVVSVADDLRLFDDTLAKHGHWSPMEHPCVALPPNWEVPHYGNFDEPWYQLRQFLERGTVGVLGVSL